MRVLEFEAKALLESEGIMPPEGGVVTSAEEALSAATALGRPVAVKAQIPMGRRMKGGGVSFANRPEEAAAAARDLIGKTVNNFVVEEVLVEEQLNIAEELFVGATYDPVERCAIIIASRAGGIEIETTGKLVRRAFSIRDSVPDYLGREVATELGFQGETVVALGRLVTLVAQCFVSWDALLLELNPLVLDPQGRWWVADAHLELDDDASYRQQQLWSELPSSVHWANRKSDIEREAVEIDSKDHRGVAGRLIPFDGDLGLLIGGGGASLTTMDALLDAGLKPANYCEIGGNPSVWKVKELTKLILGQPRVRKLAVIMNVVSNTRVDLVARGVIKGALESGRDPREAIAAFRIPGSWESEGEAILRHYGVPFFGRDTSIDQVVETIKCRS
jgi:succinyl-CoA synthetase beta subunit/citryl-CoA synthetase large subunit